VRPPLQQAEVVELARRGVAENARLKKAGDHGGEAKGAPKSSRR
jgi:hypothetical protein